MSEYIPFEIQSEIIARLPVKPLIQFRSVSKTWKSLIDSPAFIAAHSLSDMQPPRLLVKYEDPADGNATYVSFVDDESFPELRDVLTLPLHVDQLRSPRCVGVSLGLFCFFGYYLLPEAESTSSESKKQMNVVVWNPAIRKSVPIVVPDHLLGVPHKTIFGFGVSPETCDPKIVVMSYVNKWSRNADKPLIVEFYSLSSQKWKRLPSDIVPRSSTEIIRNQVVIDTCIYWLASDKKTAFENGFRNYYLLVAFDLVSEDMGEVELPNALACQLLGMNTMLTIYKVRESLAILEYKQSMNNQPRLYGVWKMDDDVEKSFVKLFAIRAPDACIPGILAFNNNGEALMQHQEDDTDDQVNVSTTVSLVAFDPFLDEITPVGINGAFGSLTVNSYMETLLLLNE